ncbi:MAG: terminase family protein [Verrucomicrobiota bacterium]
MKRNSTMKGGGVSPASSREAKEKCAAVAPAVFSPRALLLPYQERWVADAAQFKIGVWSRQTGKSFSTACESVIDSLADAGTKWVCLSAGERQALEWLEKAKEWSNAFKLAIESETEDRDAAEALLKSAEIKFANGSRIIAIPANPNTARGWSANVILDEFAYHENPDAIWAAMFPSQTNPLAGTFASRVKALFAGEDFSKLRRQMKLRVVSTFNGRDNKFASLWERREQNGYSGHMVDVYTAVKEGLPLDIEKLKAGLDDPEIWAQEYECVPMDVSAVLLPYDLLATCESTEATATISPEWFTTGKPYVLGIDFARKRDLSVGWTDEIVGDVTHCREILEMRGMSTPDQVDLLRPRIRAARRVCLDYTGPGVGMGDYLVKEFGEYNPAKDQFGKIELCTFTQSLKVDIFSKLKMAFEQKRTRIPVNRIVREDLHSVQRVTSNNGNVTYRAPHNDDGHADRCTAKALAQRAAASGLFTAGRISIPTGKRPAVIADRRHREVEG